MAGNCKQVCLLRKRRKQNIYGALIAWLPSSVVRKTAPFCCLHLSVHEIPGIFFFTKSQCTRGRRGARESLENVQQQHLKTKGQRSELAEELRKAENNVSQSVPRAYRSTRPVLRTHNFFLFRTTLRVLSVVFQEPFAEPIRILGTRSHETVTHLRVSLSPVSWFVRNCCFLWFSSFRLCYLDFIVSVSSSSKNEF